MKELILEMEHYASTNNVPIIELDAIKFIMKYIKLNQVKSILEITIGLKELSILAIPLKVKIILTSMILSFGGISVHLQVSSQISGTKIWNDEDNKYNNRPNKITLTLIGTANGNEVVNETIEVSAPWNYEFNNLYKYL